MTGVDLLPAGMLFCLALGEIYLLLRLVKVNVPKDKFLPIDGLRGVLAFAVFLHHSVIWYYFLRTDNWQLPPSRAYSHFGPSSVAMFFMITALLFFSKLLDARSKGMDWGKLYLSRVRRIMPLYIFVVLLVFVIVGGLSGFVMHTDLLHITSQLVRWIFFIEADVNGVAGTKRVVAGVVWSLAYEWLFYCLLAFVGWVVYRIRTNVKTLIISGLFFSLFLTIVIIYYPDDMALRLLYFSGGIAAAYLVRKDLVRQYASSRWASMIVIALMAVVFLYPDLGHPIPFVCLCLAFIIIASGNDLFGLLSHQCTRYLGMVSYSLYLLHGMVLFVCFRWIVGFGKGKLLSPEMHWAVVGGCALTLIPLCSLTYFYIEKVGIRRKAKRAEEGPIKIPAV